MQGRRLLGVIVGVLVLLTGITFALQGDGKLGSGSLMDSNPTWIYVGSALALIGLIALILSSGLVMRSTTINKIIEH